MTSQSPSFLAIRHGRLTLLPCAGTALGLAIFSAIATARTSALLAAHASRAAALTAGFQRTLLAHRTGEPQL